MQYYTLKIENCKFPFEIQIMDISRRLEQRYLFFQDNNGLEMQ